MENSTNFTHHHHDIDDDEYYAAAAHGYSSSNQQPAYGEPSSTINQWNPSLTSLLNGSSNSYYHNKYDSGHEKNLNPPAAYLQSNLLNLTKFTEPSLFTTNLLSMTQNPTSNTTAGSNNWLSSNSSNSTNTNTSSRGLLMQLSAKEEPYESRPNNSLDINNNNNDTFAAASLNMYNNLLCHNTSSFLNQLGLSSPSISGSNSLQGAAGLNVQAGGSVTDYLGVNYGGVGGEQQQIMYGNISGKDHSISSWCHGGAVDHVHDSSGTSSSNNSNKSTSGGFINGVTGTKRPNNYSQPSKSSTAAKRTPLKTSCPPFKVRKEKLGDRIAALHQMVSPFGKTDTASVLTEAIGYIQFLQDQIQTLCMPNVKPSRSKPCTPHQMASSEEDSTEEVNQDLMKRRGLCLVPLSWTSFITPHDQLDTPNHHFF